MKILFITSSSINGGAQKHIREMFKSLTELKHDVYLIAPNGWLVEELKEYRNKVISLNLGIKSIRKIEEYLDVIQPDITNTFILSGGIFGTLAWKKKKHGKLFVTVNNPVIYPGISLVRRILYPRMYRWMSKYASAFLVKADKVRDEVVEVIRKKKPVMSIKNGIDFNIFDMNKTYPDIRSTLGIDSDSVVVTNVGALDKRKGQEFLIQAAIKLKKIYPIHVIIVGEGADEARLKEIVKKNSAESYIHFTGWRSDINSILSSSDIFVLCSIHEGLPNALMEAMAMGIHCIATDVGGVRQLIDNDDKGIVINCGSIQEIVDGVSRILGNAESYKSMGRLAHDKMVKEYNQEAVAAELCSIYCKY